MVPVAATLRRHWLVTTLAAGFLVGAPALRIWDAPSSTLSTMLNAAEPVEWPGSPSVTPADRAGALGGNMSGLAYERPAAGQPAVVWAVKNNPGRLYRLIQDRDGMWTADSANHWRSGKSLAYRHGGGNPDAEGLTLTAAGSRAGVYVAAERDNAANDYSRNTILRYVPAPDGASLTATHEWDVTARLPAARPNRGIEAIAWIPDSYLVARGFLDDAAGRVAYDPARYPSHGDGLFFVGEETTGAIFAFALNHANDTATPIASFPSTMPAVMDLVFDAELGQLWAVCDDTCQGRSTVLSIAAGRFAAMKSFARPSSMPNLNNEGFTFSPLADCRSNQRAALWADDAARGGHVIRVGSIPCSPF